LHRYADPHPRDSAGEMSSGDESGAYTDEEDLIALAEPDTVLASGRRRHTREKSRRMWLRLPNLLRAAQLLI